MIEQLRAAFVETKDYNFSSVYIRTMGGGVAFPEIYLWLNSFPGALFFNFFEGLELLGSEVSICE